MKRELVDTSLTGGCIQALQEMADFSAQGRNRTTDTRIFSPLREGASAIPARYCAAGGGVVGSLV